jgi:prepilin-type N-terminal cleavage/methylation domain-containing protein
MGLNDQKGMTLIEILISLAILAIIIVPVLGLLSASTTNNVNSRGKTLNGAVAQAAVEYFKKVDISTINGGSRPATYYLFCSKNNIDKDFINDGSIHRKTVSGDDLISDFSGVDNIASQIGAKPYDYGIRVLLSNTDSSSLAQITVTVYDSFNKDKNKVTFTSLREVN